MCIPNNRVSKYSGPLNNAGVEGSDPEQFKVYYSFRVGTQCPNLHLWIQPTTDDVVLYYVVTEKKFNVNGPTLFRPVLVKGQLYMKQKLTK